MKQVFTARNDMEAHFVKGLLEQEGIDVALQGEPLEGAWGDLPLSDRALPSIWVNEEDLVRAEPIIENYRQREAKRATEPRDIDADGEEVEKPAGKTWKCPKCGEEVEDQFDECWNCGTERPGEAGSGT